jgi:hypothetical protein
MFKFKNRTGAWIAAGVMLTSLAAWCAPKTAATTPSVPDRAASLRQEMTRVLQERQDVLQDLSLRYSQAKLEDRTSLEAESARLQQNYEISYLTLLAEYDRVTGNTAEQQKVEARLSALQDGTVDVPPPASTDHVVQPQNGKEGVIVNGQ